ncbi:MAG TPA: DUF2442 domain-containing protein [Stellaceae bacterium]|nr:DUF2442 domain-containing protein [Stellaceae bacterium]
MRPQADTQENRSAELIPPVRPRAPWRVAEVEALGGFRLRVRFNDGTAGVVEMATFVQSEAAGVFAALRDEDLFRQVKVCLGAVSWPGGLDLAPDAMHHAIKQDGAWVLA